MSYLELWQSMGLFAKSIVVVMLIMSLWYWTITFTKWWYLRKSQKQTAKFAPEFSRFLQEEQLDGAIALAEKDRKSTRLNSSHQIISYPSFCLKKKNSPSPHRSALSPNRSHLLCP